MDIIADVLLGVALLWIARIFYVLQKGLNEVIDGLSSIDDRLARLESNAASEGLVQVPDPTR